MTVFIYANIGGTATDVSSRLRLGKLTVSEAAERGSVATSTLVLDDPNADMVLVGLKDLHINETAASTIRMWSGYMGDRTISRGDSDRPSLITGSERQWSVSLQDLNSVWNLRVIYGADGNRPAETDVQRVNWLIGSAYTTLIFDNGLIDSTGPVNLDAADYRGQFPSNVMQDCSDASGKNWFAYFNDANGQTSCAYFLPSSSSYASTLKLSNVLSDVDNVTTFAAEPVALRRDPARVFSGMYYQYNGAATYQQLVSTAVTFKARDTTHSSTAVGKLATAISQAQTLLASMATEEDWMQQVSVKVPASLVNSIRAGHRLQVKFSHLPGYSSFTWTRVMLRTVRADMASDFYWLDLDLKVPTIARAGGGAPAPVTQPPALPPDTSGIGTWIHIDNSSGENNGTDFVNVPTNFYAYVLEAQMQVLTNPFDADTDLNIGEPLADFTNVPLYRLPNAGESVPDWLTPALGGPTSVVTSTGTTYGPNALPVQASTIGIGVFRQDTGDPTTFYGWFQATSTYAGDDYLTSHRHLNHQISRARIYVSADPPATVWAYLQSQLATAPFPGQPVLGETPAGSVNGTNMTFTTAFPFAPGSLKVFVDNVDQTGAITSQTPSTGSFTLAFAPVVGEQITVNYQGA